MMDNATAVSQSRQHRFDSGMVRVDAMVSKKAAEKLAEWRAKGDTTASIISRLLERSKP